MDDRTSRLLDALDPLGASLLLELLDDPATEVQLIEAVGQVEQWTVNRKLAQLGHARLVAQESGKARAPGRLWTVVHVEETEALLAALLALSDAIDSQDKARRDKARLKLMRARAARIGIRRVQ